MWDKIALILLIIGGINWGLVGIFEFDMVAWLFGGAGSVLSRAVYILVAISAVWCISLLFRRDEELAVHLFAFPTFRRRGHFWLRFLLTALPVLLSFELVFHLSPGGLFPNNPFLDRLFLLIPTAWYFALLRLCYVCTPREALFSTSCALVLQAVRPRIMISSSKTRI